MSTSTTTTAAGDATVAAAAEMADTSDSAVKTDPGTTTSVSASESNPEPSKTDTKNGITMSFPPSHILEDGRLIYLPPPTAAERSRFFERSIARHGLLQADMEKTDSDRSENNNKSKSKTKRDVQNALGGDQDEQQKDPDDESNKKDKTAPKIHPLAVASARLQSNGLNELNRAINLATLVSTREFFSYTNVVDPSYETDATVTATVAAATTTTSGGGDKSAGDGGASSKDAALNAAKAAAAAKAATYYSADATSKRTEALFSLKRKRGQFEKASEVLERHERRLWAGIKAQHVIDQRLFQLRQQWRLVAPEHGTRARLHAARTNEVIAVDVDVYDRDRVHGGNQALMNGGGGNQSRIGLAGRLASRVPRFATIELRDTFRVPQRNDQDGDGDNDNDSKGTKETVVNDATANITKESQSRDEEMKDVEGDEPSDKKSTKNDEEDRKKDDNDDVVMQDSNSEAKNDPNEKSSPTSTSLKETTNEDEDDNYAAKWTRAEPFAIADPTLGRVIENFDPSKIPMLNLQLDIQKSSTGFLQSACLEPMTTLSSSSGPPKPSSDANKGVDNESNSDDNDDDNVEENNSDEELLISLQHSLFCANLFESMRSELDPDTTPIDRRGTSFSARRPKALQSMAWLASESEENFVAPPSYLVGSHAGRGLGALSIVHCHEGEVKVQLDSEYQLCLKLVEANAEQAIPSPSQPKKEITGGNSSSSSSSLEQEHEINSGSQSPAQLHAFCRALLLYAQDVYHRHSLYLHEREKKMREDEIAKGDEPRGLARIKKEDAPEKARILQSCVSLGSKMLFEQRIRKALSRVSKWLHKTQGEKLIVEWLSLSMFDLHSKFTICFRQLVVDGIISRDTLTITKVTDDTDDFRKVHFHTEQEFELYLKLELRRHM